MAIRKNQPNRKKTAGGKQTVLWLLLVVVLICGALAVLEWLKGRPATVDTGAPPVREERHKLPERQTYAPAEMQPYTSAASEHKPKRKKKPVAHGTVAIIIDDMGSSEKEAQSLMAIGVPLTFAVIPGLPKALQVDRLAAERGYQVMMHIPMEPKGYPQQRLESNGLLLSQTDEEISQSVSGYFRQVPHAAGANNHMGSRFTEDEQKMRLVMNQLKAHGLFYIDSRTTPESKGLQLARSMEIDAAGRNVFLDNTQESGAIKAQLEQLAALARKKGSAIGICHPHKSTIQALTEYLPRLQQEGITFVPAGELVR